MRLVLREEAKPKPEPEVELSLQRDGNVIDVVMTDGTNISCKFLVKFYIKGGKISLIRYTDPDPRYVNVDSEDKIEVNK